MKSPRHFLALTFLSLSTAISALFAEAAHAVEVWPVEHTQHYWPINYIFPGGSSDFLMHRGLTAEPTALDSSTQYDWLALGAEWERPIACNKTARRRGYILTQSIPDSGSGAVRVAIPTQFKLSGQFSDDRMRTIKNWPILSVEVKQVSFQGSRVTVTPYFQQYFRVQDFMPSAGEPSLGNDNLVNSQQVISTKSIQAPESGSEMQVRVSWSADALCDESQFLLRVGSQIRLVQALE